MKKIILLFSLLTISIQVDHCLIEEPVCKTCKDGYYIVNDKYCTFGGLPKFLETIRYHEKEKYRRLAKEFYHTYIMGPDGQKFTDSYYDKIYREIFNH